jgi:hypothetical protein
MEQLPQPVDQLRRARHSSQQRHQQPHQQQQQAGASLQRQRQQYGFAPAAMCSPLTGRSGSGASALLSELLASSFGQQYALLDAQLCVQLMCALLARRQSRHKSTGHAWTGAPSECDCN